MKEQWRAREFSKGMVLWAGGRNGEVAPAVINNTKTLRRTLGECGEGSDVVGVFGEQKVHRMSVEHGIAWIFEHDRSPA